MNCSDKFQKFVVGCERPCAPAERAFLGPRCSVRQWIQILRQLGRLLEEFLDFYVNGYTRLLRSLLVLLFPVSEVAALVVDTGSGLFSAGFAGKNAPRAVFRTIAFTQNGEVCTVYASADYFPWKSGHYFSEPLVLQYFQLCAVSASGFFGSPRRRGLGGGGVAGSFDSQVTRHMQIK